RPGGGALLRDRGGTDSSAWSEVPQLRRLRIDAVAARFDDRRLHALLPHRVRQRRHDRRERLQFIADGLELQVPKTQGRQHFTPGVQAYVAAVGPMDATGN